MGNDNEDRQVGLKEPVVDIKDSDRRAALFDRIRADHSLEITEDYIELISDLIEIHGEARVVDLASQLGVSKPTVNATIQRLQKDGFVSSKPYRSIFLTEKGRELAEWSRARHKIVLDFLHAVGVPPNIAEADAEGIEHHVSEVTLTALEKATIILTSMPEAKNRSVKTFICNIPEENVAGPRIFKTSCTPGCFMSHINFVLNKPFLFNAGS